MQLFETVWFFQVLLLRFVRWQSRQSWKEPAACREGCSQAAGPDEQRLQLCGLGTGGWLSFPSSFMEQRQNGSFSAQ
jgi:hypothetical protein